jgi:inner membrane protein
LKCKALLNKTINMEPNAFSNKRVIIKSVTIASLTLALMVPAFLIEELVRERKQRQEEVTKEVGMKWGLPQTISGFVLAIPYNVEARTTEGKTLLTKNYHILQPRKHEVLANMQVQLRKRSIYQVPLYDVVANVNDVFTGNWQQNPITPANLKTGEALLCLPVTDLKGVGQEIEAGVNGQKIALNAETTLPGYSTPLLAGTVDLSALASGDIPVNATYTIKGSGSLFFHPNGKQNHIEMKSAWKHPSFQGYEVPDSNRVDDAGFTAVWNTAQQSPASTYTAPQSRGDENGGTAFGVSVIQPGDSYSKTLRTVKYAILVIVLSFAMFFITELVKRIPVHALQYIMVGAALVIFYTLLLAISEYTSYNPAYLLSSLGTVLLIALYTAGIYRSRSLGLAFALFMSLLYAFIFIIIQLQDSALLVGSIGLFAVVAAGMYLTRTLNASLLHAQTPKPLPNVQ